MTQDQSQPVAGVSEEIALSEADYVAAFGKYPRDIQWTQRDAFYSGVRHARLLSHRPSPAGDAPAVSGVRDVDRWRAVADELPKPTCYVQVAGGIAYIDKQGRWHSVTGFESPGRPIQWPVEHWRPISGPEDIRAALAAAPPRPNGEEARTYGIIDPDYARVFTVSRCLAWQEGYALVMHGSFTRDLDLIAIPWAENATEPEHLVRRIEDGANLQNISRKPGQKPHGRLAWTLTFKTFGDPRFVDLSVVPREANASLSEAGLDAAFSHLVESDEGWDRNDLRDAINLAIRSLSRQRGETPDGSDRETKAEGLRTTKEERANVVRWLDTGETHGKASMASVRDVFDDLDTALAKIASLEAERDEARATTLRVLELYDAADKAADAHATALEEALREVRGYLAQYTGASDHERVARIDALLSPDPKPQDADR